MPGLPVSKPFPTCNYRSRHHAGVLVTGLTCQLPYDHLNVLGDMTCPHLLYLDYISSTPKSPPQTPSSKLKACKAHISLIASGRHSHTYSFGSDPQTLY